MSIKGTCPKRICSYPGCGRPARYTLDGRAFCDKRGIWAKEHLTDQNIMRLMAEQHAKDVAEILELRKVLAWAAKWIIDRSYEDRVRRYLDGTATDADALGIGTGGNDKCRQLRSVAT